MPEEIQKFDPSTLMQGVKDRIKATFVSLIPDEQWDAMVQKEIDSFFDPNSTYGIAIKRVTVTSEWNTSYENQLTLEGKMSPFQRIVVDMCIDESVKRLKEVIDKRLPDNWDFDKKEIDDGLQKIIEASIPAAMTAFFKSIAESSIFRLKDDIRNNRIF